MKQKFEIGARVALSWSTKRIYGTVVEPNRYTLEDEVAVRYDLDGETWNTKAERLEMITPRAPRPGPYKWDIDRFDSLTVKADQEREIQRAKMLLESYGYRVTKLSQSRETGEDQ